MSKQAKGTFEIQATREPAYDDEDGVALARTKLDKQFQGALEGTSVVHMIAAGGNVKGSAAYVAVERIRGTLEGRRGGFVVHHTGVMDRGTPSLTISIVPDSGTGALRGIRGSMAIEIVEGKHFYTLDYTLEPTAA